MSAAGGVRAAYSGSAASWAAAPAAVYRRFADRLLRDCPIALDDAFLLDVGAGTGATSDVVRAAGARVVAVDLSLDMLRARGRAIPAAVADICRLPFADAAFDIGVGAFVLNHLDQPEVALREVARTARPGGAVLAEVFDSRWDLPAKRTVEDVATRFGFTRPDWYRALKEHWEPRTGTPDRLRRVATDAGLTDVDVREHQVDTGLRTAEDLIAWRLSTPAYAAFMGTLSSTSQTELVSALVDALGARGDPVVAAVLVLVARVPARGGSHESH